MKMVILKRSFGKYYRESKKMSMVIGYFNNYLLQPCESESRSVMSDSLQPHGLYIVHGILQVRILECVAFPFSQVTFPTQWSNPGLPHCRQILYQLSHKGSPRILEWVAYPFSRGSSWARNQIGVSYIAGGFFTNWATREYNHNNFFIYWRS